MSRQEVLRRSSFLTAITAKPVPVTHPAVPLTLGVVLRGEAGQEDLGPSLKSGPQCPSPRTQCQMVNHHAMLVLVTCLCLAFSGADRPTVLDFYFR